MSADLHRRLLVKLAVGLPFLSLGNAAEARVSPGAASFSFELLANGIFVQVRVNGKGPFCFALDTGSTNSVVASELISEIGITSGTQYRSSGAGSDSNISAKIEKLVFELPGGLTSSVSDGAAISMAGLWPLMGRRIYGVIGFDVMRSYVVDIDYALQHLTLHQPASYSYTGPGTTLPFRYYGNYDPQIQGALVVPGQPPIPVWFTIDCGAGGTIVSAPLVDKYRLLDAVGRSVSTRDKGVGGAEPSEVEARLSAFRIGPYTADKPIVALSRDKAGALARETIGVNLGGNILRRFRVIIDYSHQRLTLEPNGHLGDPFEGDASGLLLHAGGDDFHTFVVDTVTEDSPAGEAGLRPGDIIAAIDGKSAGDYALWQFEESLKRSGRSVELTVRRSQEVFVRTLKLRSLI